MIIRKINASYTIKKQLRQYEPIEVQMAAQADVTEDENIMDAQKQLFAIVKQSAEELINRVLKEPNR